MLQVTKIIAFVRRPIGVLRNSPSVPFPVFKFPRVDTAVRNRDIFNEACAGVQLGQGREAVAVRCDKVTRDGCL